MKRLFAALLFLSATILFFAFVGAADTLVEPYSSRTTAGELAFVAQRKQFIRH